MTLILASEIMCSMLIILIGICCFVCVFSKNLGSIYLEMLELTNNSHLNCNLSNYGPHEIP